MDDNKTALINLYNTLGNYLNIESNKTNGKYTEDLLQNLLENNKEKLKQFNIYGKLLEENKKGKFVFKKDIQTSNVNNLIEDIKDEIELHKQTEENEVKKNTTSKNGFKRKVQYLLKNYKQKIKLLKTYKILAKAINNFKQIFNRPTRTR